MKTEFLRHKISYLILIFGLLMFSASFLLVWPVISLQRGIIVLMTVFYFLWGVFSHLKHDNIGKKVIVEYLVVALLAGLLLLLVTF